MSTEDCRTAEDLPGAHRLKALSVGCRGREKCIWSALGVSVRVHYLYLGHLGCMDFLVETPLKGIFHYRSNILYQIHRPE